MEVFSRKFEKELIALRKEFDLMASNLSTSSGIGTEGSGISMGMSRSASLDEGIQGPDERDVVRELEIVGEIVQ